MEIKHIIVLISIFYLLRSSSSSRTPLPSSSNNSPLDANSSTLDGPYESSVDLTPDTSEGGSSTPVAPDESSADLTPDSLDGVTSNPEAPDETVNSSFSPEESPHSPYYGAVDLTPEGPRPSASFSFTLMPGTSNPELEKICKETELPIECMKSISPLLNDTVQVEPITVAKLGIELSTNMSRQAADTATKLYDDPEASGGLKEALSVCIENYESIPDDNDLALLALNEHNLEEAMIKLSGPLTSMETCLDANHQMHNFSPMRDMEAELEALVRVNLHIVTDLVKF
ncbi:hypothetical protein F3Y22_tig00110467pilonHSYRG00081 [Hibiscus syriacus]|uniref:Pectinesterase inhibitor domain-containing protein n=1 Tax=Hibiscus syriacus TaxID=106335 RepID=A0A6A3AJ04_HIBSY|nr:uncharacterized protein LOC120127245 [Hibiscus syriacus]KAE8703577.1 hypothetical protein F3Y22_tig00110467pilonHSYRG00081 [Hibiscus syriacus]